VFLDFYASYVALQLAIANNWYKIPTDQIGNTVAVYLLCWLVATVMVTLATLRLPVAFTLLLGLVDVVLAVLLVTIYQPSTAQIVAGLLVFAFVAVGTPTNESTAKRRELRAEAIDLGTVIKERLTIKWPINLA
jgi:succinate-acetate transporter protein